MSSPAIASENGRVLRFIGNYTGPVALAVFGVALWHYQASENLFTFAAWGTLDIFVGLGMIQAGAKKEALLPLLYGVIAFAIVVIIYQNGKWGWGTVENICTAGVAISMIGWRLGGPVMGVLLGVLTMGIASVPILVDNFYNPQKWEWWLWVGSFISSSIGLYLSRPWTMKNLADWSFVATSELVGGTLLLILWLR